jgi:signal peptidase II
MNDTASATAAPVEPPASPPQRAGQHRGALVLFLITTLGVLAADLGLKYAAFRTVTGEPIVLDPQRPGEPLPYHEGVAVLPGVLELRLTTNTGAVFGLGQGGRWLFVAVSVLAIGIITRIFWRSPADAYGLHLALALILAGALGNLYDRVRYSAVRDMLLLFPDTQLPFGLTWPRGATGLYPWIFNLADAALVIGVLGVLVITWTHELRRRKPGSDRR